MGEFSQLCKGCLYGKELGGGVWGCASEKRRIDRLKLVHDLRKEHVNCNCFEPIIMPSVLIERRR